MCRPLHRQCCRSSKRAAGSLLNAIGLPELVAASLAEYEVSALQFAREPETLAASRGKLERNRLTALLFDIERDAGDPPRPFAVQRFPA